MLLLEKRRFGFTVYLFGASESAARYSGVSARRVIFGVYAVSGLLSATAGLLNLGITNSANVDFGTSYVLLAVLRGPRRHRAVGRVRSHCWRRSRGVHPAVPIDRA